MHEVLLVLSRRAFIKLTAQLPGLLGYLITIQPKSAKEGPAQPHEMRQTPNSLQILHQAHPYGTGIYGQGLYPEYHISIPVVNKE